MNTFAFHTRKCTGAESTKLSMLEYPLLALTCPGRVLSGALKTVGGLCQKDTVLPAGAQRSGQHDGSGVDGLVETLPVYPSGEFSYQNRSHPLAAQLLMNAQEPDVHHALLPVRHIQPAFRWRKRWQCLSDVTWTHAPVSIYEPTHAS